MQSRKSPTKLIAAAALAASCTAVAMLAVATVAQAADLTPQEKALVEGTKKEGAVTLLNPIFSDRTGERLGQAFVKRYGLGDGFKFNNLRKGTGQTVAQVRQEIVGRQVHGRHSAGQRARLLRRGRQARRVRDARQRHWKNHAEADQEGRAVFQLSLRRGAVRLFVPAGLEHLVPGHGELRRHQLRRRRQARAEGQDHRLRPHQEHHLHQHGASPCRRTACVDPKTFWDKLKATDPLVEFRTEAEDADGDHLPAAARHVEPVRPRVSERGQEAGARQGNQDRLLQGRPGDARQPGRRDQGRARIRTPPSC